MNNGAGIHFPNLLSEFVYVRTYARWIDGENRRETWPETVDRYVSYYIEQNAGLKDQAGPLAELAREAILKKDVLPSMRALWCAGPAMDRDSTCGYNCSYLPIDNLKAFAEALYILMCGTGVGFSVERTFVGNLPIVSAPTGTELSYLIEDSTEGWADSLHYALVEGHKGNRVSFDYSLIRPKGARLRVKGGRASGPEPLKRVHDFVAQTLAGAAGRRLKSIEAHDIMCMIAEIVMVGGFRRASLISFSDPDDADMRHAKDWNRGTVPSIRYMANNSAVWLEKPERTVFDTEWRALVDSGSGERGFYVINDSKKAKRGSDFRSNPCVTGDTRVLTTGGFKRIKDCVGKAQGIVTDGRFGVEGNGGTTPQGAFKTGIKDVWELTTVEGYRLKLTADHRVMTPRGWVEAHDLRAGDKVHILSRGGGWEGTHGSKQSGALLGWLAGDGCIVDGKSARLYFYGKKRGLTQLFASFCEDARVHSNETVDRDQIDIASLLSYTKIKDKTDIPEALWCGSKDMQMGYLTALFSADGSIQGSLEKGISVRLSSINLEHLRNVQLLLLNFGIFSRIYQERSAAGYRSMPDGKGGLSEYYCQTLHELVISKADLRRFEEEIGFVLPDKQAKLEALTSQYTKGPYATKFLATVETVIHAGVEEVYDLTETSTHSFSANGIVVHNCGEILLRYKRAADPWTGEGGGGQFCNLTAAVIRSNDTAETLKDKVRLAAALGVIQASYTHFPYLRPAWKQLCDEDRLLGVDLTGQCDNFELSTNEALLTELNEIARTEAIRWSDLLGNNHPAAITCGKPSGNSSQLVDCSSGFHPRYAKYYFRHVRVSGKDPLFKMIADQGVPVFKENGQEHLEDDQVDVWVARFPVKAPEGAMLRDHETALEQCERYLKIMRSWCGNKGHNQSATIYVRPDEWDQIGDWLYEHFDEVTGLSFLPHADADTKYRLLPYQEIDEATYNQAMAELPKVDFGRLRMYEQEDEGEGASEPACVGGICEL